MFNFTGFSFMQNLILPNTNEFQEMVSKGISEAFAKHYSIPNETAQQKEVVLLSRNELMELMN
jgi:hypothetical protein